MQCKLFHKYASQEMDLSLRRSKNHAMLDMLLSIINELPERVLLSRCLDSQKFNLVVSQISSGMDRVVSSSLAVPHMSTIVYLLIPPPNFLLCLMRLMAESLDETTLGTFIKRLGHQPH